VYPLIYIAYELIHGAIVNAYSYPFIDVNKHGYGTVLKNGLFLGVGYYLVGLLLIATDKAMAKSFSNNK
jgi:hypothetical protein